jgi:hypothetical protein
MLTVHVFRQEEKRFQEKEQEKERQKEQGEEKEILKHALQKTTTNVNNFKEFGNKKDFLSDEMKITLHKNLYKLKFDKIKRQKQLLYIYF